VARSKPTNATESFTPGRDCKVSHEHVAERRLYAHAKATANPQRPRTAHAVPPEQLFELGLQLMSGPCQSPRASPHHPATQYRGGLMIATLISCPMRLSNLEQIEIGKHLLFEDDHYWLRFPAEETKTGEPFTGDLPRSLTPWSSATSATIGRSCWRVPKKLQRGDCGWTGGGNR
jgi:hypothetical protein